MEEKEFSKEFVKELINKEFSIGEKETFLYKKGNLKDWKITIRREEEIYSPFTFAIEGEKIDTKETWSRRYLGIKEAILHILNDFNENASIENKYSNIEEYLNEKIKLIYKYEENGNYYYEDENKNLYCENGNQNIGEVHLMYCTKEYGEPIREVENLEKYELVNNPKDDPNYERKKANEYNYMMLDRLRADCDYFLGNGNGFLGHLYYKDIDKHIEEMKKIYESFSNKEKPEWISLENIENYKAKMNEKLKEYNFEKQDYKYIIKCDLDLNNTIYMNQYLLVEDDKTSSDMDVDLIGDCCFNCDCKILDSKIVAKVYSLEDVKEFCKINKIEIEKNLDKEGNLIIGASKDMIIASDLNRYDKEREIELNNDEIGGNND